MGGCFSQGERPGAENTNFPVGRGQRCAKDKVKAMENDRARQKAARENQHATDLLKTLAERTNRTNVGTVCLSSAGLSAGSSAGPAEGQYQDDESGSRSAGLRAPANTEDGGEAVTGGAGPDPGDSAFSVPQPAPPRRASSSSSSPGACASDRVSVADPEQEEPGSAGDGPPVIPCVVPPLGLERLERPERPESSLGPGYSPIPRRPAAAEAAAAPAALSPSPSDVHLGGSDLSPGAPAGLKVPASPAPSNVSVASDSAPPTDDSYYTEEERAMYEHPWVAARQPVVRPEFKWLKGELLGKGAFGQVFLAFNCLNGSTMAVKQVVIDPRVRNGEKKLQRVMREVGLLASLQDCQRIVRYYGCEHSENNLNIFMEYVPCGSVSSLLRRFGQLADPVVRNFTRQVVEGLHYLHSYGVVHRDIKGGNILVGRDGDCKLADFGASETVEELATDRPDMKGTSYWMAPEVASQQRSGRKADIWSLGCTVVEMYTGRPPFADLEPLAAIYHIGKNLAAPPVPPADLPEDARDFISQCLTLDPLKRPNAVTLLRHPFLAGGPADPSGAPAAVTQHPDFVLRSVEASPQDARVPVHFSGPVQSSVCAGRGTPRQQPRMLVGERGDQPNAGRPTAATTPELANKSDARAASCGGPAGMEEVLAYLRALKFYDARLQ